jgi:hypothetical protein
MQPLEQHFQWAVQALAQPADVQPILFPSFVVVADEVALDFDNWRLACESNVGHLWSQEQRQAVEALDDLLDQMSGPERPELWDSGCLNHPKWSEVRQLAGNILSAFGWPPGIPPLDRAIYARYAPESPQSERGAG